MTAPMPQAQASQDKGSFLSEAWKIFRSHGMKILPLFLVFILIESGATYYRETAPIFRQELPVTHQCDKSADRFLCRKEHKDEIKKEHELAIKKIADHSGPYLFLLLVPLFSNLFLSYWALHHYLERTDKIGPQSWRQFGRFFWTSFKKNVKPILWNLIPIFGPIMYVRSIIRYTLAPLLAIAGKKDPLKKSWDLTEGHVWRIFGAYSVYALSFWVCFLVVLLMITSVASHNGSGTADLLKALAKNYALVSGLFVLLIWVWSALPVGIYRVLLNLRQTTEK